MNYPAFIVAVGMITVALLADRTPAQSIYEPYTFTTLVGNAGYGSKDGTGSVARFLFPRGVAIDQVGNLYVADTENHTIRKVTPARVVTTLAGSAGSPGSSDGSASAARFNRPHGVAVDGAGNVYVADTVNYTIRKITPVGIVTTLAGLAGAGSGNDGTGSEARFSFPTGVATDDAGNVYVADMGNYTIRKITPQGAATTLAGLDDSIGSEDGTGSDARFSRPWSVATDRFGNVYVADSDNYTIRRITPAGLVTTVAGVARNSGATDGTANTARFAQPTGVAVDGVGNVFVADKWNHTIRKITPSGEVTTFAGLALTEGTEDGTGNAARFNFPEGLAVDLDGNLYVADTDNHTIRKITADGTATTVAGFAPSAASSGTGYSVASVAVDKSGNVYMRTGATIEKITASGVVTTLAGSPGYTGYSDGTGSVARFSGGGQITLDNAGNLYTTEDDRNYIRKVTPDGVVTTIFGLGGFGGIAVDDAGNIYVGRNNTIHKRTPDGVITTLAGQSGRGPRR